MADQTPTDTPSRILEAALELFTSRGYQRTSLRQIAERLGITKAAVLYHFPAKDRILTALTAPMLRDLEAALDRAERLDPAQARWAAIEGLLDAFLANRQALLTARHDLSILTQQREVYQQFLQIGLRSHRVVAGPAAGQAELIRASQAIACLGDPVIYFPDAPVDELRERILEGARWMLAGPQAYAQTGPPAAPGDRVLGGPAVPDRAVGDAPGGPPVATPGGRPAAPPDGRRAVTAGDDVIRRSALGAADGAARVADASGAGGPAGAGRPAARTRRRLGRPRALDDERLATARRMHAAGGHSVAEIAAAVGVSRATLYRHLRGGGERNDSETHSEI